jgi:hypothetical protein
MAHEKFEQGDDENRQESDAASGTEEQNLSQDAQRDAAALAAPSETDGGENPRDLQADDPTMPAGLLPETGVWEIAAGLGFPSPPPAPPVLPETSFVDLSMLEAVPEVGGESSAVLLPGEWGGGESSAHDLVERFPRGERPAIEQPIVRGPESVEPLIPDDAAESPIGGREDISGRLAPIFGSAPGGEIRVAKRLLIEVEVVVTNAQRVSQIATHDARGEFQRLADASVYKVANDFRTFRESYRRAWDWKQI